MFSDVVSGEAEITFQIINDLALLRCFMRGKISVQFAECLIREGQVGAFVDFAQNSVRVLDPFMEIDVDGLCFRKNIAVAHASFQKAAIPIYPVPGLFFRIRSEEHTSELQSLMRISYAVFCLKKQNNTYINKKMKLH